MLMSNLSSLGKWAEESLEGGKTGGKLNLFIKRTETLEKLTHLHIKLPPSCQHVMLFHCYPIKKK